ncbi:uncharacterized protein YhaN [Salirhabdus euzebyi]|uniref:Uncharacterized protein YhaN n=1 Tax=Salirhabdus euzebyi TaxID=394506 RepID=A0A841Q8Q9_9BACI|nr:AAA family ATPase [Salirhabdus euzebyi]MBB6454662.1 uncharacterized protein YhaN [Salirhabdus euzebyi]
MIIEKIHIYHFGKWKDTTFSLDPSLTVFNGPNESGKTSLKYFIQFILFNHSIKKQYEPKDGNVIGGRLFLSDGKYGQVIIERVANKRKGKALCLLQDGQQVGEEWLSHLLNGMDRHTFENIFTFDDRELQNIQHMNEDDLGRVLFGVGLSGSEKIASLEKDLTKQLGDLFKPKGKKPIINEHLQQMKEIQKKIDFYASQQNEYNQVKEQVHQLTLHIQHKKEEIYSKEKARLRIQKYFQVKEPIQQYYLLHSKVKEYRNLTSFPNEGLKRFQQIKELLLPVNSEWNKLQKKIESKESEICTLNDSSLPEHLYIELKEIDNLIQDMEGIQKELIEKKKELEQKELAHQYELDMLGVEQQGITFSNYTLSMLVEEKWKSLFKAQQQLSYEKEQIEEELFVLEQELSIIMDKINELKQSFITEEEYEKLKKKLQEHERTLMLVEHNQHKVNEHEQMLSTMLKRSNQLSKTILVICLVILFGAVFTSIITSQFMWSIFGGVAFLVGGSVFWMMNKNTKQLHKEMKRTQDNEHFLTNQLTTEKHDLLKKQVYEMELQIAEQKELEKRANELESSITIELQKMEKVARKRKEFDLHVQNERTKYPFLNDFDIEHWPSLYHRVNKLQNNEKIIIQLQERIKNLEIVRANVEEKAYVIAQKCKLHTSKNSDLVEELIGLKEKEDKCRQNLYRMEEEVDQLKQDSYDLKHKKEPYEQEQKELFELAFVNNEEEFLEKGKRVEEKQKLQVKMEEWLNHIHMVFHDKADEVINESLNWDELELSLTNIDKEIDHLNIELDKQRQSLADRKAEMKQLEDSEQLSDLRHQFAMMQSELKEQVKQWITLKAAESFLRKTKETYQREYLPEIINLATFYFQQLTKGKYTAIIPPKDKDGFQVRHNTMVNYEVHELSTGTIAQLYVSLRIALSEVMSDAFPVPFIIDDAFVHFDGQRKEEMISILRSIAKHKQIIYFTCKESEFKDVETCHIFLNEFVISS